MEAGAKDTWTKEWKNGRNQAFQVQVLKCKFIINGISNT